MGYGRLFLFSMTRKIFSPVLRDSAGWLTSRTWTSPFRRSLAGCALVGCLLVKVGVLATADCPGRETGLLVNSDREGAGAYKPLKMSSTRSDHRCMAARRSSQ